jgi:hypothetical protein
VTAALARGPLSLPALKGGVSRGGSDENLVVAQLAARAFEQLASISESYT